MYIHKFTTLFSYSSGMPCFQSSRNYLEELVSYGMEWIFGDWSEKWSWKLLFKNAELDLRILNITSFFSDIVG